MAAKKKNKSIMWLVYVVIIAGFFTYIVFNDYGLLKYMDLKNEVGGLQQEITDTELKMKELDKEIDSLKNSLVKIEQVARERYHMLRKNEKAFRIEKN